MLFPFVALLFHKLTTDPIISGDDLPPGVMIADIPSWAFDMYSREGRAALSVFLRTDAASARWICGHIPRRRVDFLGNLAYRCEGSVCSKRLHWPLADELRRQVDLECSGPECTDASEILALVREDIPKLNEVRAETQC